MNRNWIIIMLAIFTAVLIGILITKQNVKDKKSLIQELDNDYQKPKENEPEM